MQFEALRQEARAQGRQLDDEPPPAEPLVAALELIAGLIEGLRADAVPLLDAQLPHLALAASQTPLLDVRQAAFGVCGDLAVYAPALLEPVWRRAAQQQRVERAHAVRLQVVEGLMPLLLHSVHPAFAGVCNNALWTLGELASLLGAQFAPVVEPLMQV